MSEMPADRNRRNALEIPPESAMVFVRVAQLVKYRVSSGTERRAVISALLARISGSLEISQNTVRWPIMA